jgi:RNA polymerase sigma factor (sigma-70 family)
MSRLSFPTGRVRPVRNPGPIMLPSEQSSVVHANHLFATTQWSAVFMAKGDSTPTASQAREQLCMKYWYPLYAYVRRHGHKVEDAEDLTQEFFTRLLKHNYLRLADRSRGRFRTFLLTSLKHFLINEWTKANREKRGSGQKLISLDEEMAESRFNAEPAIAQSADTLYDRGWADALWNQTLVALQAECEQSGKFTMFQRLKGVVLGGSDTLSYSELAGELGMTEGAVRVTVHRLRERFNELLRAEVAQTVSTPAEVNEELRYLVTVIRDTQRDIGNNAPEKL